MLERKWLYFPLALGGSQLKSSLRNHTVCRGVEKERKKERKKDRERERDRERGGVREREGEQREKEKSTHRYTGTRAHISPRTSS